MVAAECSTQRILISGASGFIGSKLLIFLRLQGYQVFRLVRKPPSQPDCIYWNPEAGSFDKELFENFDAVILLAGAPLAEKRWTAERKRELIDSRCRDTRLFSELLSTLDHPPKVVLSASAIGYYGNRGKEVLTEESPSGQGFLAELCRKWEQSLESIQRRGSRVVSMRFGIVLSEEGGFLKKMLPLFRWGLGGRLGSEEQIISWIALEDLLSAIVHILNTPSLEGPVNCVTAYPISQAEFVKRMARHLHRPAFFHLPEWLILLIAGEMGKEMLLSGSYVVPEKLLSSGFSFQKPKIESFLSSELFF